MRRTVLALAGGLLFVAALGSDSPKEYDDRTEIAGIEGTWKIESAGLINQPIPLNGVSCVQTFRSGRWAYHQNGIAQGEGFYTTDNRRNPAFLNETTTAKTTQYIYQLDHDTLRTAFRQDGGGRPRSFDEAGIYICVWKRVGK